MSRVRRLSIRGVRNFNDETEEIIKFTRPLTLIVGQNGVGKTTVIESLRYATTGEFPPGSDRGKGFIHDPTLKKGKSVQVRGCIKAELINKTGDAITVSRSIEATARHGAASKFRTIDNTLNFKSKKTGKETAITHRCADVDLEIKSRLGLSSAILNNVIFCHQDDANWPLDDSKKLKERLDEIFDTTRFNKALDHLRKLIKLKQADVKILAVEKNGLTVLVREVEAKELKYREFKDRQEECTQKVEDLISSIRPVNEKIDQLRSLQAKFGQLQIDRERKELELNLARQQVRDLESTIKERFSGTDDELQHNIKSYDDILIEKNTKITKIERKIAELIKHEDEISSKLAEQRVLVGTLHQQVKDQSQRIKLRNKTLDEILKSWKIEPIKADATEVDIQNQIDIIDGNIQELEGLIRAMRVEHDNDESILEKKVDLVRDERTKIDVESKRNEQETSETRKALRETREAIAHAEDEAKKVKAVETRLESINQQIKLIDESIEAEGVTQQIQEELAIIEKLENDTSKTDDLLTKMQTQASLFARIETLKSELEVKHKEISQMEGKHGQSLKILLGKDILTNKEIKIKDAVTKLQTTLTDRLNKLRQDITNEQIKATSLETSIEHTEQELKKRISQVQQDKEKIMTHCANYKNYNETLNALAHKLKGLENKRGMLAHQGVAYREYMKKLSNTKPCCPLCKRDFAKESEAKQLVIQMENDLKQYPNLLKQCEAELNKEREKHHILLSLKTTVESVIKFEEVEREKMKRDRQESQQNLLTLRAKIRELQDLTLEPEKKIALCNNISGDLALWDRYTNDITRIQLSYDEMCEKVADLGIPSDRTLEDVQNEREAVKQEIKSRRDTIASLRVTLDTQHEERRYAIDARAKCLEDQLKIHNEVQKAKQLKETYDDLIKKENTLKNLGLELKQKLIAAENELDTAVRQLEEVKAKNREELDRERHKMMEYTKQYEKLSDIQTDVKEFQARKIESRLSKIDKEMNDNQTLLNKYKREKAALEQELSDIKEAISCQETKKRNLSDNLDYRQKRHLAESLEVEINALRAEIRNSKIDDANDRLTVLMKKSQELDRELASARAVLGEIENNVKHLQAELEGEEYRTARDKYQRKWLEQMATEDVIRDLTQYSKALDLSMSDYHEERMNSVNKSMENLWKLIYRGSDTTSIQIRTEAATQTATGSRRQFNYRLVQTKHDCEMDMRGRCSAGQRVLASIIIRLALAETFCDQCGMLALDEPTTNLDKENSASLAETLYHYVRLRAKYQSNFQLIIITHDTHFIQRLSELNKSNGYYQLYRGLEGFTKIAYYSFNDTQGPSRSRAAEEESDDDDGGGEVDGDNDEANGTKNSKANRTKKRGTSPVSTSTVKAKRPFDFGL